MEMGVGKIRDMYIVADADAVLGIEIAAEYRDTVAFAEGGFRRDAAVSPPTGSVGYRDAIGSRPGWPKVSRSGQVAQWARRRCYSW